MGLIGPNLEVEHLLISEAEWRRFDENFNDLFSIFVRVINFHSKQHSDDNPPAMQEDYP